VSILEARKKGKVAPWSKAWIEERGRPEIAVAVSGTKVTLTQKDPLGGGVVWPQRLEVLIDGERREVAMTGRTVSIATKARPRWALPNGGGLGYGLFRLDAGSREYLLGHVEELSDALTRGSAWVSLWEELMAGDVRGSDFLDAAMRTLPKESEEQNMQRILSYAERAFWHEIPAAERFSRAPALETLLREGMAKARTASQKSAWFQTFRDVTLTQDGVAWLERVWRREEKVEGLTFAETDEIEMALQLAVREAPRCMEIMDMQLARTQNPDRKARFAFVMPALSTNPAVREEAFARLLDVRNRSHEPWVLESLRLLNHPLREAQARQFVAPALELLPEIQRTGDIFFPKRWMDSTLSGHRSKEAASAVREYLAKHPELPQRLRWVVLSAADDLLRIGGQ
jgi:aminopeptidase N